MAFYTVMTPPPDGYRREEIEIEDLVIARRGAMKIAG